MGTVSRGELGLLDGDHVVLLCPHPSRGSHVRMTYRPMPHVLYLSPPSAARAEHTWRLKGVRNGGTVRAIAPVRGPMRRGLTSAEGGFMTPRRFGWFIAANCTREHRSNVTGLPSLVSRLSSSKHHAYPAMLSRHEALQIALAPLPPTQRSRLKPDRPLTLACAHPHDP